MKSIKRLMMFVLAFTLMISSLTITSSANTGTHPNTYYEEFDGYAIEFQVTGDWGTGFNGQIKLINTGTTIIESWILAFNFEHEINNFWSAEVVEHVDDYYLIKSLPWNADVYPGQSVVIGFSGIPGNVQNLPSNFILKNKILELSTTDYRVDFNVISDWGSAFNGEIIIENTSDKVIEDWFIEFEFDKTIQAFWTAEILSHVDNKYFVQNRGYNANIQPGEKVYLGFSGYSGNVQNEPINIVVHSNAMYGNIGVPTVPDEDIEDEDTEDEDTEDEDTEDEDTEDEDTEDEDTEDEDTEDEDTEDEDTEDEDTEDEDTEDEDTEDEDTEDEDTEDEDTEDEDTEDEDTEDEVIVPIIEETPVGKNGQLQVIGTQLSNEHGEPIQLRGMSSHGLQWYGHYMNKETIKWLRDDWNANVIRLAMYTDQNGYIQNPDMKNKVIEGIEEAIELGMYVIVDWHILYDNNPNIYKTQAKDFFDEISRSYGHYPNIIYEICNEPNGDVTWERDIRPYAEEVIEVIRNNDDNNIIIVGTATWSQDVHLVSSFPIEDRNVMYALHFYAGTHGQWLRDRAISALDNGIPIFVSEFGTSSATGGGGVFLQETSEWLDFLDEFNISWINWSLCDKDESSAALNPGASNTGEWDDDDLSSSGRYIRTRLRSY
jgi:aryl-phospho-beta-D-glucosidase BglC (GH1 family)